MTEYEKLLQAVSSAEPEYLKFSQWSADKQITDSVDGRLQYADYLRKVHIDAGAATADTEKQIQQGLYSSLVSDGSLEEGDYEGFQQLTAPKDIPFETKVSLVQSHLGTDDPDWETIAEYNTVRGEVDPEDAEFKDLQTRAEEAMDRKYDVVKRKLLRSKQLPFIATTDEDGNRTILASDAALNMSFSDALQASQAGGVSLADAYLAKTQLEPVAGTNLPRFKFNRIHEAKAVISKMSELTPDITTQIAGHSRNLSESEDSGFLDWSARKVNALGDEIMGFFSDEAEKQLEALEKAQDITKESAVKTLTDKLNNYSDLPDGEEYSYDEVAAAYDIAVLEHGTYNDEFEVYEGEEAGKNLRMTSSGIPVIHPAVIANENAFNDMVKARPDVSPEILDQIRSQRSAILDSNFSQYSQLLGRSAVEDEWNEALMTGRAKGLKNHEILNDFLKDEDNYSMIAARASGLWWSFAEGLGTLLAAVPAALGSETAQDYLVGASQLAADRREVAELFGKGYGVIGEAFESIAPMTVDLVATGLLATASAPAGGALGAAYVTARAGSIAGIKALTKGVASNVIKTAPKLIGKGKSALPLKEVIETSLKTVDGQLANKALKGYNSALAQKIGVTSALFVPAATRSGAASYGSITNALRQTTDLSNEEIHNRAVGAALLSGTVTGLVTSGFSLLGRGGIDDALLRGMSFKEFKSVLGSVSDFAENFSDKKVKDVLIATVNKAKDKLGPMAGIKPFTKGLSDEALEEGLDQFLNSFVEDAALDQNTPLLERLQQTFHAAVIGGMIGAGVPVVQKLGERFRVNSDLRQQQQRDIRMNLFQEAAKNLRETGSPAFAQVFEAQFAASARSLKGQLTLPDREKQPVLEQTKGTVLEGKSMKEIEQLAQIANSSGETDVVTEEQLAASQFLQELNEETQAQKVDFTEQAQVDEQTKGTVLEGKSFDEITRLAQVAESAGETDVITEEQNAAIALLQQIEALSQNQEAQQAQEEAGKQAEEKQKQQDAVDTEQTLKDLQNTPAKILRRKINGILSNNSPEKLENYPKAKKEATATATTTDPDITVLPIEPEVRDAEAKFTEDPDVGVFRSGEQFTVEESDALESVLELAQKGYPVRFTSSKRYGVPFTTAKIGDKADFLAKKIFSKYPLIKPEIKGKVQAGLRSVTRFDPETGTIKKGKVSWKVDNFGNGLFNNDPVVIAEMLAHNVRIPVPDSVNVFDINPSIKVKDGFVVDVIKPSDTGVGVVSAVNPVSAIENLKLDTSKVELATRIPFIEKTKDATVMPFGTREINERGFTQDVSDRQITYGDIKQQLDDFFNRASNTTEGDLKKPILGKSREAFGYDLLDETNAELAFTETYLQYRQLLHFFELKGAIESQLDKHIQAIGGQTKVKATRQSKNAIKKALMSRVGVESEAELAQILQPFITGSGKTHTDTIISFVEDNVLNNPDFDAGSMPTLDTVFKRNVKSYVAKEKVAGSLQRRNIEVSNTDLGLDQAETPFDDMYGQGDQGLAYAGSLGSVDPSDTLGDNAFYDTIKSVTENLISQIDESPELKEAITDLYIQALYPDATPRQRDLISKQKTSDMVSTLGTYLGTGSHTSRPEVLEFIKQLEDASLESGVDLKNGLYLSYLTYRYEGNPLENAEVVSEVRRLMSSSLGRNVSEADARNFIKAMDGAVRSRFSRSHVSEEVRAVFESMNMADVERLGLKDGDPESVISALQKIAESSDNESHKLVAQLLLEDEPFLRSVQFSLGSSPYPVAGQHNVLTDGSHVVYVNLKTGNGLGLENVLLEEYVHAFLADVASKPDSALNENQKLARQRLKGLYELAEKAYRSGTYRSPIMEDAFENFDEFLAKFLLSPHLQAHIKGLKAPAGQRGFFSRIIDSLLSMFRKLTGREKSQYADALSDIIALSKTPVRSIVVPAKQVAAENAETAARAVDEVTEVLGAKQQRLDETQKTTQKELEKKPDPQDVSAGQVINQIISDTREEGNLSSSEQRRFESLMYHLKSRVPVGVTIVTDTKMSAPAAAEGNVVILNPRVLMQEVESFDSIGAKIYLETLLNHELAHVASFNALTVSEINDLVESLTDEDYIQIANTYYRIDSEREEALNLLQTEVNEKTDPEVSRKIAEQKLLLAEEKLRMHLEKVMSGTTTEEDLDFWSSKPSLLRMITRYIRAAYSKMVAYRAMNGGSGTLDSLLRKVHNQAVLLELGFNRTPVSESIDINNPEAVVLEFARLTSVDPLDEAEEEQERVERYARLYASRMPVDFQNRIMKRAGLRFENGTTLVDDDTEVEEKEVKSFDTPSGIDHDGLLDVLKRLSNDKYDVDPSIYEDDYSGIITLEANFYNKEGKKIASLEETELRENGEIHVGYVVNNTPLDISNSFSTDLMTATVYFADELGVKKITTEAAGSNINIFKRKLVSDYNNIVRQLAEDLETTKEQEDFIEKGSFPFEMRMNGYASWPKIGFKPDKSAIVNNILLDNSEFNKTATLLKKEVADLSFEKRDFLRSLPEEAQDLIQNKINESIINLATRASEGAEFLRNNAVKDNVDGRIDLVATFVEKGSKALNAWKDSGGSIDTTFDLTERSESLKAYARRTGSPILASKEVRDLVSEFKEESSNPDADVEALRDQFNDRAYKEIGLGFKLFASRGQTPTSTVSNLNFSDVVKLLELPMTEFKAYKAPSGWLSRLFAGDVGAPIKNLLDQRDEFKRATTQMVQSFQKKFKDIIEKDKVDLNDATLKLIGEAQGYVDGDLVSESFYNQKEAEHEARKKKIEADATLSDADKKVQISASNQQLKNEIEAAELAAIKAVEATRDRARIKLAAISPDLSTLIVKMRKELIEPMQDAVKSIGQKGTRTENVNGLSNALRVRFDQLGGIYVTRSYRIFNDPTFARKVREDKNYASARKAAMDLFERQLKDQTRIAARKSGMSSVDADLAADKALRDANRKAGGGRSYAENVLEAFISRYEGVVSGNPAVSNKYSKAIKNLNRRKFLPKELRDILGEYGEESGTDLIVRTMATVANLAAEYTFRANVAAVGLKEGFLVDAKTAAANSGEYFQVKPTADQNDPLANLYAKKEVYDDIKDLITPPHSSVLNDTSASFVKSSGNLFSNLTGKAMLFKTLGSVGFYLRNILGNVLFFGPSQGMYNVHTIFKASYWSSPEKLDAKLTELVGLGVLGDELRAGILRELLDGKPTPETMIEKFEKALDEAPVAGNIKKFSAWTEKKLTRLSAAIDGAYKIAYYEHELDYLQRAKLAHPNSEIGKMGEYELKRMAAKKVKMTAQSLSQAPPVISQISKSSYGMLFATFIRFKAETARIFVNTHRLSKEEKASDNPMIQARGRRRIRSMYSVTAGVGMAIPSVLAHMFGIGEDEDEALRKSMPEYLQGHTFFYWKDGKDLLSFDMTYLNPFSLLSDPTLRAIESIWKGNFGDAVWKFVQGMILDTYLDDQILAGSVMDVKENRDPSTDQPIWIKEVDSISEAIGKALLYVVENAYEPRILGDALEAVNAAQGDNARKFADTFAGELAEGMYPIRAHNVDPEKQFRRFLRDHQSRMRLVTNAKFSLYNDKPMTDDAIREVYQDEVEGRRKLNNELFRVTRGFDKLGVNLNTQYNLMRQYGVGKDKARLIHFGVMDRPDLNKRFLDQLIQRGHADRGATLLDERNKYARYMTLD